MTQPPRTSTSQDFADQERYHRREWIVQRAGWIVMMLFILAAGLGVFGGSGLFTRISAGDSSGLTLSYDRFLRYAAGSTVDVSIDAARSSSVSLAISDSYLQQFELQSITPEPRSMHAAEGRVIMTFDVASTDAARAPTHISLRLKPEHIGTHTGVFRSSSGAEATIKQFVYP